MSATLNKKLFGTCQMNKWSMECETRSKNPFDTQWMDPNKPRIKISHILIDGRRRQPKIEFSTSRNWLIMVFHPQSEWGGDPSSGKNPDIACIVGTPCQKVFQDKEQNNHGRGVRGDYQGEDSGDERMSLDSAWVQKLQRLAICRN